MVMHTCKQYVFNQLVSKVQKWCAYSGGVATAYACMPAAYELQLLLVLQV